MYALFHSDSVGGYCEEANECFCNFGYAGENCDIGKTTVYMANDCLYNYYHFIRGTSASLLGPLIHCALGWLYTAQTSSYASARFPVRMVQRASTTVSGITSASVRLATKAMTVKQRPMSVLPVLARMEGPAL